MKDWKYERGKCGRHEEGGLKRKELNRTFRKTGKRLIRYIYIVTVEHDLEYNLNHVPKYNRLAYWID